MLAFSAPLHVLDNVPLPFVRLPAIATMCRLHAQDVVFFSHAQQHRLHEEVVGFMRYESYGKAIGPPARRCRSVGKTLRICVPGRLPMAKCSRNAFPGGNPWQVLRSTHPKSGFGRENRQFVAAYCRRVFKMSWLWKDMRAMHPKSPANRLSGTHGVKILPGKGSFRCTGPSNHARRANLAIL